MSDENANYSILLGSALRKNDVDEFFKIYDNCVPKNLPEEQVEHIKEEARKISELPESKFTELIASSQDYSNRPAIMTDQGRGQNDIKYKDEDDDIHGGKSLVGKVPPLDLSSIKQHSRHLNNSHDCSKPNHYMDDLGKNKFAAALKLHEEYPDETHDAELGCAGKTSDSTSDTDPNGSDSESMPGMFHYIRPFDNKKGYGSCQTTSRSAVQNDKMYDEAYPASDSDISTPMESPREGCSDSGIGGRGQMTEMKTFRTSESVTTAHREDDNDSNDELNNVNLHQRLYAHNTTPFTPMGLDKKKGRSPEYEHANCSNTGDPWVRREMPEKETFRYSGSSNCNLKSTLIGAISRNGPKTNGPRPPFGDPLDVKKIGSAVNELITRNRRDIIRDMPASAPITEDRSSEESTKQMEGTKKKKKKKKATKGDGGSVKDGDSVDENGNPVEIHHSRRKEITEYQYHHPLFPRGSEDLQRYSGAASTSADYNGPVPGSSTADDRAEAQRKRKAKKQKQEHTVRAEEIPDYRGRGKLEDILEFIENGGNGKKKKKSLGTVPATNNLIVDYKNKPKTLRDNKKSQLSSPPVVSLYNGSDKEEESGVEKMIRESVRKEPRRLSDLSTQKIPLSNHSSDARNLDKYDLCLPRPPDVETLYLKEEAESDFKLVTKNKKKKRPMNNVAPFRETVQIEMSRETRSWRPVRSVTPPPTKLITDSLATPPKAEKPAERAFSPSAFPVLASAVDAEFPYSRGRRNSTGNVPFEAIAKDSEDVEVQKTPPPAVDSKSESKSPVSPPGKISYAKIAASPKPKDGVLGNTSTSMVSERRHSFGSIDDANQIIKEAISMVNKNDPKSQSQELVSKTRIQEDNDRATARKNLDSAFHKTPLATSAIQQAPSSKVAELAADKNTPTVTLPVPSHSSSVKNEKAVLANSNHSIDKPPIQSHTVPRVARRSKAKCVIFLDKKANDMPKNLGITFGFDENEARSQGLNDNSNLDANSPTSKNTCIDGISFKSEPLEQIDGHKLIIPVNGLTLPAQGLHVPVDQNQQIILASQSNQNQHTPVVSGAISDNNIKWISVPEEKMWDDLLRHESMLVGASSKYNAEECVRYLVREWEKVTDAKNKGVVLYQSD